MQRRIFSLMIILLSAFTLTAQKSNTTYNKALADSLGADGYGMKKFQFVILKTGARTIGDKDSVTQIFKGHMSNINRLVKEGSLIVAGPFGKNDQQYRGLFIFNGIDRAETEKLLITDP